MSQKMPGNKIDEVCGGGVQGTAEVLGNGKFVEGDEAKNMPAVLLSEEEEEGEEEAIFFFYSVD